MCLKLDALIGLPNLLSLCSFIVKTPFELTLSLVDILDKFPNLSVQLPLKTVKKAYHELSLIKILRPCMVGSIQTPENNFMHL